MSINANSRIVIKETADKPAGIVVPAPNRIAEIIAQKGSCEWSDIKGAHKEVAECCECDAADIPDDRTFRDAWEMDMDAADSTYSGKRVRLNKAKGVEIAKQKIREVRNKKLKDMDVKAIIADEKGDKAKKAEVITKKQKLRDATDDPRLTLADNEVDLKLAMSCICDECEAEDVEV